MHSSSALIIYFFKGLKEQQHQQRNADERMLFFIRVSCASEQASVV